jgi:phosphotransferase system  glucose/maltose/N-acetylglucosamine-specific IIC component
MESRPTKRALLNGTSALRGLMVLVCLLSLAILLLAVACADSPGHAGSGLLWANLAGVFIFFAIVVVVSLHRSPETFRVPSCEWAASISPRAPPFA